MSDLAVVFDMDGVLWYGGPHAPIVGASDALKALVEKKIPFYFITNSGGQPEKNKSQALVNCFGIQVNPEQVVCSHTPLLHKLKNSAETFLLINKSDSDSRQIAEYYGITSYITIDDYLKHHAYQFPAHSRYSAKYNPDVSAVEPVAIHSILLLHEPPDWGETIQVVIDLLCSSNGLITKDGYERNHERQFVNLYLANPDLVTPTSFPAPRITMGALLLCLASVYKEMTGGNDLRYEVYGKPYESIYRFTEMLIESGNSGNLPGRIYAIGDNPLSDIKGANEAGEKWFSILVRSGCFKGDNDVTNPGKHACDTVLQAVQFILAQHK